LYQRVWEGDKVAKKLKKRQKLKKKIEKTMIYFLKKRVLKVSNPKPYKKVNWYQ